MNHDVVLSILSGATGTAVFVAVAKHMPDWPITCRGLWEWFRGSIQEIAAQRSGGTATSTNPTPPVDPAQPKK